MLENKTVDAETNDLQAIAANHLKQIKEFYIKDPSLLLEQYELERKASDEYDGRQLLELIQNADDAAITASDKKALIHLNGDRLIIANTGEPFTKGGLDSILHSNLSPKFNEVNQIGNKGLGFRAILSWAKKVTIKSGSLNISFSKDYSLKVLDELIKVNEEIKNKIVHRYKKLEAAIAILRCPEIIENLSLPVFYQEYDTVIILDLKQNIQEDVRKQLINKVDAEIMLFLNHIDRLEIKTDNSQQLICRSVLHKNTNQNKSTQRMLISVERDGISSNSKWNINSIKGVRKANIDKNTDEKNFELSVAWQDDLQESKNLLHSYFMTDVQFKFPGILHGTFELSGNRNELIKGEGHNSFLFAEAAKLIADTAELIANSEVDNVSYKAMDLAMIDFNSLGLLIKDSGFESLLKEEIKKRRIFPTIGNTFIDWTSKPVYYKEPEFAQILNAKNFDQLLLCCRTNEEEIFLKSLSPFIFKIDYLIKEIGNKRHEISISQYARLICVVHSKLNDTSVLSNLPPLFFDEQFNLLEFSETIFLPSSSTNYSLPIEVGVQIIHPFLVNELLKFPNLHTTSLLVQSLSKYAIKEFKFSEIVEALIEHYYQGEKTTIKQIKELQKHLFDLYKKEGSSEMLWKGKAIHFINKSGEIKNSMELYFGKEYENKLIEELYSYDKSKLIAGPKKYDIDEDNLIEWKKYLNWTGVVNLPRRLLVKGNLEYAKYTMRKFDFKNKVEDYLFKNYAEYEKELTGGYGSINVSSIDDIDKILVHNNSNTILAWINSDERLMKELDTDHEASGNFIHFFFYNAKRTRIIFGGQMKNYIKWKLKHTPWLLTESGIKQCPFLCTTAATITQEFSPLIEKPLIEFESLFLKGINKDKVDYLFSLIGVHKTINTFSTGTLYSILLKLPEIDLEGKKAKVIYNQLATNFEEKLLDKIDKLDGNYKEFNTKGKVFTKRGKESSYVSANDAFYVNDKRFGESIISQFNTILIDRRRGKAKIKSLFGVSALDNINLKLLQEKLITHPLTLDFELEIEHFKPYVYVLRQDVDNGTERNLVKGVKFILVTELVVGMLQNNEETTFTLEPYEFFNLKTKNIIYIKTPPYLDEIKKLKEDILFCSVIAEAFSALLDVDTQRPQIRELFSNSMSGRNEIIRTELDDVNLERLSVANNKLGISSDPKLVFWASFLKCFPSKKIQLENLNDEDLKNSLLYSFPQFLTIINEVFDEINYTEINDEQSSILTIRLFVAAKITIEKFNHFHYPSINIKELYEISFQRLKEKEQEKFNGMYYERCLLDNTMKGNYLNTISSFSSIKPNVVNEIDYNIESDLYEKVLEKYSIDLSNLPNNIKPESIYLNNKKQFILKGNEAGIDKLLIDQFLNENLKAQSLLFFDDRFDDVFLKLNDWVSSSDEDTNTNNRRSKSKKISYGQKAIFFDDFVDLKEQLNTIISNEGLDGVKTTSIKIEKVETKTKKNSEKSNNNLKNRKPSKPKEDIAFLGEYLVYKHLLNTTDKKDSVKWVSEYARRCEENLDGIDGLGYDLQYIPNGSIYPRYVEVKVIGWEDAFHISSNEVKVGEKLKKNFEVFLVRNIETPSSTKIEKISGLFDYKGKSFTDNELFTVINDNFILKFRKKV